MKTIYAAAAVLIFSSGFFCMGEDSVVNTKPLADVQKEIKEGKAIIVDVRAQSEWDKGHVKDAKFVPITTIKDGTADLASLPKDKTIYTYCARGGRAKTAAEALKAKGYNATSLKEGFEELSKNGFESVK
ncbi:MAG TPA: rhodanese-like domain-containing protein [Planctomycetota bacterium]|nr:rhodanese-like domain-containing protein [Planctomycetota bacterium]